MRIGYREIGAGPVVILLHGISSAAESWSTLAETLSGRFRVIAWDAPGYGGSDPLRIDAPRATDYADVMDAWVDALRIEAFHLVGHSLGAMMAAAYASTRPQRIKGLLLADPAQGYEKTDESTRVSVWNRRELLESLGPDGYAERRGAALLRPTPHPDALETVRRSMRRLRMEGFAPACAMLANDDIWNYLEHWRGPLLVACGERDTITPAQDAAALARRMGATLVILPDAGHASYLDAPASFADALVLLTHTAAESTHVRRRA